MLVETKTKEIIDKINANEPIEETVKEINQLVYQLYNLTDKEIETIEESVK
jgi:flagellar hook-associated protein FlgK